MTTVCLPLARSVVAMALLCTAVGASAPHPCRSLAGLAVPVETAAGARRSSIVPTRTAPFAKTQLRRRRRWFKEKSGGFLPRQENQRGSGGRGIRHRPRKHRLEQPWRGGWAAADIGVELPQGMQTRLSGVRRSEIRRAAQAEKVQIQRCRFWGSGARGQRRWERRHGRRSVSRAFASGNEAGRFEPRERGRRPGCSSACAGPS